MFLFENSFYFFFKMTTYIYNSINIESFLNTLQNVLNRVYFIKNFHDIHDMNFPLYSRRSVFFTKCVCV